MVKEQMGYDVWVPIRPVVIDDSIPRFSGGRSRAKWGTEARICTGWRVNRSRKTGPASQEQNQYRRVQSKKELPQQKAGEGINSEHARTGSPSLPQESGPPWCGRGRG